MKKTGVLLINLGTPDDPSTGKVRKYLSQFLNDPRVIDIPRLARKLLVNLIIVPFRAPKSAKIYKQLWTPEGSPLLLYGESLRELLSKELDDSFTVELAMRYGKPGIPEVVKKMEKAQYDQVIVLPLFPHYASASTGSALELAMKEMSKWYVIPEMHFFSQYYDREGYIDAFVARAKQHDLSEYEHVLFSYHGLPERHVDKTYPNGSLCADHNCETAIDDTNHYCYKATCYATSRALAEKLGIDEKDYTVCFQSRLDKKWLTPFSDDVVKEKAQAGVKKMLAFSPAFVADCLETTIEIGHEYQEIFEEHGGEKLQLVESLNDHPIWVNTLKEMVLEKA